MLDFSHVNNFTGNNQLMHGTKNIEEVAILYFYIILKDTIEKKCFNNCPVNHYAISNILITHIHIHRLICPKICTCLSS